MNDFDRENLAWYLSASESEREQWAEEMGMFHIAYMIRLLKIARAECTCETYDVMEETLTDYSEAQAVLARIMAL